MQPNIINFINIIELQNVDGNAVMRITQLHNIWFDSMFFKLKRICFYIFFSVFVWKLHCFENEMNDVVVKNDTEFLSITSERPPDIWFKIQFCKSFE